MTTVAPTLFFSAKLNPPTKERPKWRLVEGVVHSSNATNATADGVAEDVEMKKIGTFGANEFEEALLSTLGRFQPVDGESEEGDEDEQ